MYGSTSLCGRRMLVEFWWKIHGFHWFQLIRLVGCFRSVWVVESRCAPFNLLAYRGPVGSSHRSRFWFQFWLNIDGLHQCFSVRFSVRRLVVPAGQFG